MGFVRRRRALWSALFAGIVLALGAAPARAATPPANTVAPSLSGTAQDGKTLTASRGTWTGTAPIAYAYQWQASTDGGATWSDVSGATGTSYTPPAGSAGEQVHVVVTATNSGGTGQATSAASASIVTNPPTNTVAPSLSGIAQDGVKLTAARGTWAGVATITYAYQWQASSDGGTTWNDISGATASTYTPPAGSAGEQVQVVVTGSNGDGTAQAVSPASAAVLASPPTNTVAPSVSGTAQDGKALSALKGTWTGVATIAYAYQWQASSDGGATWNDISAATGTSFTPPAGSAGEQLRVVVTASNGDGAVQAASSASAAVIANPPVDTVAPSVGGTAQDGSRLTAAKGTWTGVATITYAYQWQASTDGGATWSNLSGATASTYTLPAGSAGEQVRVVVTATNPDGTAQAASSASAAVVANPPVDTVAPSVSGTAQDGVKLTAVKGTWTGMATITYAYRWQASSDGGATWSDIAGATASTYTLPAGSAGEQVRVVVTATNPDGTAQAASPASPAVIANPPVDTLAPSVNGTPQDGVPLTAASGTWSGMATITYGYQWQASTDNGATWSDVSGATASTYTPPAGSAGEQVRVVVTATNPDGTAQATSPASATVVASPPVDAGAPGLSGTAEDGLTLTATSGSWNGIAAITYAYQWQVSTDGGATWSDISGATGTSYTPPAGSAGDLVRVAVTASNGDGSAQAVSPASATVVANPPVDAVAPSLGGTAQDGVALTATSGSWTGVAAITYAYQWQVSTDGGATWSDISGATGTSYTPPAGSAGDLVRVAVTASNGDGSAQATSSASATILAGPPVDTVGPSLGGTAQAGVQLTAAEGTWTGAATITCAYQWQVSTDGGASWSDISGATATAFTPSAGFAGKQVRVQITATNGDGSSQAVSPASAAILSSPAVAHGSSPVVHVSTPTTQPAQPQPATSTADVSVQSNAKPELKRTKPKTKPKPKNAKPKRAKPKKTSEKNKLAVKHRLRASAPARRHPSR